MTEIQTLQHTTQILTTCPALVVDHDGEAVECGGSLAVVHAREIRGDDYGSWTEHSVSFECGHSLKEMETALKYIELGAV